jgi:hypothetical protein
LGTLQEFDPELILDEEKSLEDGAVLALAAQNENDDGGYYRQVLRRPCASSMASPMRAAIKGFSAQTARHHRCMAAAKGPEDAHETTRNGKRRERSLRDDLHRRDPQPAAPLSRDHAASISAASWKSS